MGNSCSSGRANSLQHSLQVPSGYRRFSTENNESVATYDNRPQVVELSLSDFLSGRLPGQSHERDTQIDFSEHLRRMITMAYLFQSSEFSSISEDDIERTTILEVYNSASTTDEENTERCTICLVDYENGDSIRKFKDCKHYYHDICIATHLTKYQSNCPQCRKNYATEAQQARSTDLQSRNLALAFDLRRSEINQDGRTVLMFACIHQRPEVVDMLSEPGYVNNQDMTGFTALMYAASVDNSTIIAILLAADANVHLQNNVGDTALHIACRKGNMVIAKVLSEKGASFATINLLGSTPFCEAVRRGNLELLALAKENPLGFTCTEHEQCKESSR